MTTTTEWRTQLREALEYAPANPQVRMPHLVWHDEHRAVCALCATRLVARGCSYVLQGLGCTNTRCLDTDLGMVCDGCGNLL